MIRSSENVAMRQMTNTSRTERKAKNTGRNRQKSLITIIEKIKNKTFDHIINHAILEGNYILCIYILCICIIRTGSYHR